MIVYDFDDTIYDGDSSIDMVFYTLKNHPFLMIKYLIKFLFKLIKYKFNKCEFKEAKEILFAFLFEIKNLDNYLNEFVESHMKNIKPWYKKIHKDNDLIISASYELWINKFCKKLNIKNAMGTKVDMKTGKIIGKNCSGNEKIKRYIEVYKDKKILKAFSDSKKDIPLLEFAKEGYVVKGNKIVKYYKGFKF